MTNQFPTFFIYPILPQERYLRQCTLNLQQKASSNHKDICVARNTGMGRDEGEELELWRGKKGQREETTAANNGKLWI